MSMQAGASKRHFLLVLAECPFQTTIRENQQPKTKSYWENYRFGRDILLNFDCRNGKEPWHRQTLSSFYFLQNYSEGEVQFSSCTRMCKTHWFSTKLSAEDKNICGVLLLQSKQRAIGPAPSPPVITDNVCSWQYHHYELYYLVFHEMSGRRGLRPCRAHRSPTCFTDIYWIPL